ncbi:MAG: helix-turn-helix transcriptional regulator [Leptolyngbyaceae cyanobacterium SL_7_1]|nr:helix-turn-helix transcriptional regulator [Leptolyngbyaceae cyanobacterium SL_7_1]
MVDKLTPSVDPTDSSPLIRPDSEDITISKLEEELLSLLVGQERYGLEIIQAFKDISGGKRNLSVGTLYPTLNRLEEKQLITSRMEDRPSDDKGGARRKYFRITRLGFRVLAEADRFRQSLIQWQAAT